MEQAATSNHTARHPGGNTGSCSTVAATAPMRSSRNIYASDSGSSNSPLHFRGSKFRLPLQHAFPSRACSPLSRMLRIPRVRRPVPRLGWTEHVCEARNSCLRNSYLRHHAFSTQKDGYRGVRIFSLLEHANARYPRLKIHCIPPRTIQIICPVLHHLLSILKPREPIDWRTA